MGKGWQLMEIRWASRYSALESAITIGAMILVVMVSAGAAALSAPRAKALICRSQLKNLREGVVLYRSSKGSNPSGLLELFTTGSVSRISGLGCPETGASYIYDWKKGEVRCAMQGHESF